MTWEEFLALPHSEQEANGMAALRETVAEAGEDFIYRNDVCCYVADGSPSCLIAKAVTRLGAPLTMLAGWDSMDDGSIVCIISAFGYPISSNLVHAWIMAQYCQDRRKSWGDALSAAEEAIAEEAIR